MIIDLDKNSDRDLINSLRFVARARAKNTSRYYMEWLHAEPEKSRIIATNGHRMHWRNGMAVAHLGITETTDFVVEKNSKTMFRAIPPTLDADWPSLDSVIPKLTGKLTCIGGTGVEFNTLDNGTVSTAYTQFLRALPAGYTNTLNFDYFADVIDVCPFIKIPSDKDTGPILFADHENAADATHYALIMPMRG